ncbi:MAG: hypothetical protein FJX57_03660, partial [Alphaproteobacteria bacterium]|nr:hypothetical protein [Alphaproteobacteria bacterium]
MPADFRRTWLPILGLSLTTLVLIGTLVWSAALSWRGHAERHESTMRALVTAIAARVGIVLHGVEGDLRAVRDSVADDPGLMGDDVDELKHRLAAAIKWNPTIGAINVFSVDGVLVASSAAHAPTGIALGRSERFERLRATPDLPLQISTPLLSTLLGEPVFSVTLGLADRDGRFVGMIGGLVPTRRLLAPLVGLKPSAHVRLALVGEDGRRILDDPESTAAAAPIPLASAAAMWAAAIERGRANIAAPPELLHAAGRTSARRIDGYPLMAAASATDREVIADWWHAERGMLFAYAGLGLIVVILNAQALRRALATRRQAGLDAEALRQAESSVTRSEKLVSSAIEAQRVSDVLLRDAVDVLGDGVTIWDSEDRLLLWNRRYLEISPYLEPVVKLGISFRELYAAMLRCTHPGLDPAALAARVERRLAVRGATREPLVVDGIDGQVVEIMERRTGAGGLVCVYHDVTGHRRKEAELAASEARFRDGIEAMEHAFALYDRADRLVAWNSRYIELMPATADKMRIGVAFADLIDRVLRDARPQLDDAGRRQVIADRLAARERRSAIEFETPEKRVLRGMDRTTTEGGHVEVIQDVTESRALLARLSESEERFRDFAETASDWFWETDAEHRFAYISVNRDPRAVDVRRFLGRRWSEVFAACGVEVPAALLDIEARMDRHEPFRNLVYPDRRNPDEEP